MTTIMTPSNFDGVYFVFIDPIGGFTSNLKATWLSLDDGSETTYDLKDTSKFRRPH